MKTFIVPAELLSEVMKNGFFMGKISFYEGKRIDGLTEVDYESEAFKAEDNSPRHQMFKDAVKTGFMTVKTTYKGRVRGNGKVRMSIRYKLHPKAVQFVLSLKNL